jgi:Leucine-rich repeat (LRR) protein
MADIGKIPALQELYLGGQPISDRGLQQLGNLRQLKSLGLAGTKVTVKGLLDFPLLPNLEKLYLNGLPITDDDLKQLQPRLPRLSEFSLHGTKVTDEGLRHLPPNVWTLFVAGTAVNGSGFANLKGRSFWRIVLDGTPLNDAGVGSVRSLASVANLDLTDTRVTDAGVEDLISVPGLQAVYVTKNRFSAKGLAAIKAAFPKVDLSSSWEPNRAAAERVVSVNGRVVVSVKGNDAELVVATAQDLSQDYFQVRRVDLAGVTKPLDSVLSALAELKDPEFDGLESIDLSRAILNDAALAAVAPIHSLKDLSLAETQVTPVGLAHLSGMTRLRRLILDGAPIQGGLENLKPLRNLAELRLACPRLTDFSLQPVGEITSLERLSLAGAAITDEGLTHLLKLKNLKDLDLRGTKVTPAGVDALQKSLPQCTIHADKGQE